jgi:hypothetical protein
MTESNTDYLESIAESKRKGITFGHYSKPNPISSTWPRRSKKHSKPSSPTSASETTPTASPSRRVFARLSITRQG